MWRQMTREQRKQNNLINAIEECDTEMTNVVDTVYKLIDKEATKRDVNYQMNRFKERLKRLDIQLKNF